MTRSKRNLLPSFIAELEEIKKNGITEQLLMDIIKKHQNNAKFNKRLYERYMAVQEGVDIFKRRPRYKEDKPINNKINHDFFGEIVDFKVGYFAGKPVGYGYSNTEEAEETTGGEQAVDEATKAVTDFITRNNMYGVDIDITKFASICGYAGRLFYIDPDGNERVMATHSFETIILSSTKISEPEYAIRYSSDEDISGNKIWTAEFYDQYNITTYKGGSLSDLKQVGTPQLHCFDYCPLQGIENNTECMGDAEKVMALIDDYDKVVSDNSNELEAFVHAYLVIREQIDDEEIEKAQKNGCFQIPPTGVDSNKDPIYWLTKNINDTFTQNHLNRNEDNIYRFSKTPNLGDEAWGNASGVSLKFKLHGLEVKCSLFQAKKMDADQFMWKLLASAWAKKQITVDPLQCTSSYERNFPKDHLSNAQTAQAMIGAGIPKRIAWDIAIPEIDDIDYVMEIKEQEDKDAVSLFQIPPKDG